jgi:hypothetical protein
MGSQKAAYLAPMKTLKWMALLPFLLAGASACDDFGLASDPNKEQGELRWTLDRSVMTKAGNSEIPDTNDFLLTIYDAQGNILYDGTYGDSPEYLTVDPGNYTVSVKSISFQAPAFSRPQYGDEQVVVIAAGQKVNVTLRCTLLNAGIKLNISSAFPVAFPDGVLFIKQDDTRLKYLYKETRIAYTKPGNATIILYNEGKDEVLLTRNLEARQILNLGINVARTDGQGTMSVVLDTSKVWTSEQFVIGGDNTPPDDGREPSAISVGDVSQHIDEKGVWVYGYIVGGDLTSNGKTVKTSGLSKATHLALADRSSITAKASCLAVELPKGKVRDALNLVDHPNLIGRKVYVKGDLVAGYFGTRGLKNTNDFVLKNTAE